MRPASSLDAFAAAPAGTYVRGETFLYLCETEELYAFYLWGRPTGAETKRIIEALAVEVRPEARPHRAFVDMAGLTWIDSDAFTLMRDFLEDIKQRQKEVTVREAVVRPGGVAGAVVAGFFALFPPPYVSRVFTEAQDAIDWLGIEPQTHRAWNQLRAGLNGVSAELARLRELLAVHYREADLAFTARALSCSTRTLQRRLRGWGTGFQQELDAARVAQAQRRLTQTDDKLAAISLDIGFGSPAHFSEWFKQQTGETADELRRRNPAG